MMNAFGNSIDQYVVYEELGRGGFAVVYRAVCRKSGVEVAIKMIDRIQIKAAKMSSRVNQEVSIQNRLKHSSFLQLHAFFEDDSYVYLVLELCHNGNLQTWIKKHNGVLSELEARTIMKQVVEGLIYLHSNSIIHRDITLSNLLLTKDMNIKISDFGLAIQLQRPDQKQLTMCGTPNYISPEIATRGSHGFETDIWGLGIMLYVCLVGKPPFETEDGLIQSTFTLVVMSDIKFPKHISHDAQDLIKALLQKNPKDRINLQNVLEHPFLLNDQISISTATSSMKRCISYDSGVATASYLTSTKQPFNSYSHGVYPSVGNCGGSLHNCPSISRSGAEGNLFCGEVSSHACPNQICTSGICLPNNCCSHQSSCRQQNIKQCSHHQEPSCGCTTVPKSCCSNTSKSKESSSAFTQKKMNETSNKTVDNNTNNKLTETSLSPPLSSRRLRPIRQKTKNVICSILSSGDVCLEFIKHLDGHEIVWEVMRISSDGMRIIIYHPNKGRGVIVSSESPPPLPTSGNTKIYNYENIPEKYWRKYCYAAKFVTLVQRRTPKITFYSSFAKCYLMENLPSPDFQACFYEGGIKISKSDSTTTINLTSGELWTFENFKIPTHIPNNVKIMLDHFKICLGNCETFHKIVSESTLSQSSDDVFPVIFGKRPQSQQNSPLQVNNRHNQENLSPQSVINIPSMQMQGYETSIANTKVGFSKKKRYPS